MNLYEEFKLYETMWEDVQHTKLQEKKPTLPKPFLTKERGLGNTASIISSIAASILIGTPFRAVRSVGLLISNIVVDIVEAFKYHRLITKYDNVKRMTTKSYNLRRNIYKLIDEVGIEAAADMLEALELQIKEHPELFEVEGDVDISFNKIEEYSESLDYELEESLPENTDQTLDMSMDEFLKALSDMRAEVGDDHTVDVDEINEFMRSWKAENSEIVEV